MDMVIHYAELGLKGKNRPYFEIRLVENIKRLLGPIGGLHVKREPGRITAELPDTAAWEDVRARLRCAFGVSYFAQIHTLPRSMEALKALLAERLPGTPFRTFASRARRMNKDFELTSDQMNREIGAWVLATFPGTKVDLERPEMEIFVEVMNRFFLVYFRKEAGPGGLPVGVSGKVLTLLSGGIDSPVAAWRMCKRGCRTAFVHFHSMPFTSKESVDKVRELAARLNPWQGPAKMYLVPFGDLQQAIVTGAPAPYRVILYRRFMIRIAQALAWREGARALVTGESLGQVASQTLQNMATIGAVATLPVLRPLIGMDKQEIINTAREIGTFDTSTLPHDDCCSYLMPRSPATASTPELATEAEKGLDVAGLVKAAVDKVEEIKPAS